MGLQHACRGRPVGDAGESLVPEEQVRRSQHRNPAINEHESVELGACHGALTSRSVNQQRIKESSD